MFSKFTHVIWNPYVTQIVSLGYLPAWVNLPYIAQTSREVDISFCRHKLWDRLSHNQEEG